MHRFATIILVYVALVALCACSMSQSELPGKYVGNNKFGSVILVLKANGTFDETVEFSDPDYKRINGERLECQGTWKSYEDGVSLDSAYSFGEETLGSARIAQFLPAEKWITGERLVVDADNELYLKKAGS